MTEQEKELSGVLFDTNDPELMHLKQRAHMLSQKYNETPQDQTEEREKIIHELFQEVGENFLFQGPIFVHYGSHTKIGKNFFANFNLVLQDDTSITIGDNCDFGPGCALVTPLHPLVGEERYRMQDADGNLKRYCYARPIEVGNNVWFGANVTVCPGVKIGDNCVIGAGSVVTRDIPADSLAFGSPAKVIRKITEKDSMANKPEIALDVRPREL